MTIWTIAVRGQATAVMAGSLLCGLTGCFVHKKVQPQPVILARQTTVPLETPPAVADPPLLDAPNNQVKLPPVPVAEAATKPKRLRRKPKQTATAAAPAQPTTATTASVASPPGQPAAAAGQAAAPVQVAGNVPQPSPAPAAAADTVLGALTPGGVDQTPQARQDAQELLVSTDRRLNALPAQTQQMQRPQISQIRNFWKQGVDALKAGDAEGAKTLALKAKLLLDDLEKAGQ